MGRSFDFIRGWDAKVTYDTAVSMFYTGQDLLKMEISSCSSLTERIKLYRRSIEQTERLVGVITPYIDMPTGDKEFSNMEQRLNETKGIVLKLEEELKR